MAILLYITFLVCIPLIVDLMLPQDEGHRTLHSMVTYQRDSLLALRSAGERMIGKRDIFQNNPAIATMGNHPH